MSSIIGLGRLNRPPCLLYVRFILDGKVLSLFLHTFRDGEYRTKSCRWKWLCGMHRRGMALQHDIHNRTSQVHSDL